MADGHLWRIVPSKGSMDELAASHRKITGIVWPVHWEDGTQQQSVPQTTYSEIIVSAQDQQGAALYLVNLRTGSFRPIQTPTPAASLVGYSPADGTGIFFQSDRTGLFVWRTRLPEGPAHEVLEANEFLRDVEEAQTRLVDYTSMNGKKLPAWLMLPIGYRAGTRYPLITWVYAGDCPSPRDRAADHREPGGVDLSQAGCRVSPRALRRPPGPAEDLDLSRWRGADAGAWGRAPSACASKPRRGETRA